ncbi:hypothetical protein AB3S75_042980 [Citrus x aurantiifolia]
MLLSFMLHLLSSCRMYCFILAPLGCNQKPASSFGACVILLCSLEETNSIDFEATYQPKTDLLKALAVFAAAMTGAVAIDHSWVAANQDLAMALLFGIGYTGIIFEGSLAFNKSGVGLLMAVSLWTVRSIAANKLLFFVFAAASTLSFSFSSACDLRFLYVFLAA